MFGGLNEGQCNHGLSGPWVALGYGPTDRAGPKQNSDEKIN
jgi:hypothetical protein